MKKLLSAVVLMLLASPSFATTYKCYRYVDGHPVGTWIKVKANSKSEAESKVYSRFKEIGGKVDSVNCH